MKIFNFTKCALLAGVFFGLLALWPGSKALASLDSYEIQLRFPGPSTIVGMGAVEFDSDNKTAGTFSPNQVFDLNTTDQMPQPIRGNVFDTPNNLQVVMRSVNFSDDKTPENQITGTYVEGLTGELQTSNSTGANYVIVFNLTGSGSPNLSFNKTYDIFRILPNGNRALRQQGTYSIANVNTVPEPGTLAIFMAGLTIFAIIYRRRKGSASEVSFRIKC